MSPDAGGVAHVAGGYEGGAALAVLVVDVGPGLEQELDAVQVSGPAGGPQGGPQLGVVKIHLKRKAWSVLVVRRQLRNGIYPFENNLRPLNDFECIRVPNLEELCIVEISAFCNIQYMMHKRL